MSIDIDRISPPDAQARLQADPDGVVLLDCRQPLELTMAGIQGALHIPMAEIPGRRPELDRDKELIVFCHHGIRSMSVTAYLRQQGFEARNMTGGIDAWSLTVDAAVPRY